MKIAWFTPFHDSSAIGQVSRLVCEELQKSVEVDLWTASREHVISTSVPVIQFATQHFNLRKLQQYDHVVYNMGNYAGNHREIWDVLQSYSGVLLLHDQLMQNFFSQITMMLEFGGSHRTGEKEYLKLMRTYYGWQGEVAGKSLYKLRYGEGMTRLWDSDSALAYPLYQPLLGYAKGVFTHASFFVNELQNYFYGTMDYAYLPHTFSSKAAIRLPDEFENSSKALIVSTGIVHPVKRIERVAEMLLSKPDIANRIQYVVIGEYGGAYGDYLKSLAAGPLRGCLYLLGYQAADVMDTFLKRANFCINLRFPNSEVCSKSLIEQMSFGKPVIVLNSGIYGEMPNDCVLKLNIDNEMIEMEAAFRTLLDNKTVREEVGRQAAAFVEKNCTTSEYVKRFKDFLARIDSEVSGNKLIYDSIQINKSALNDLGFNPQSAPDVFYTAWNQLSQVCNATDVKAEHEKVLGIWLGFPYSLSLRREGITKFLLYMLMGMLDRYPIMAEIWAYSINEEEVKASFEPMFDNREYAGRVVLVTEKNYKDVLRVPPFKREIPRDVNESMDNLADLARVFSHASSFVTAIVYLDNVIRTGKPLFVPVHDLGIHVHYNDFVSKDPLYKARFVDIRSRAENLARAGAFMFSNSEVVRKEHVLKFVSSIQPSRTAVVYLPVNVPKNIENKLLTETGTREKFHLKKPYIFYPTQIRPYKNVTVLVRALSLLKQQNLDIQLVVTGNPADVPEVEFEINRLDIRDRIVCLSTLTEYELFSLYRYAAVAVVPTLFEGGFPWQACEALFMDTPLVLSKIPIVEERIEFTGMSLENCGLILFDPEDPTECALGIIKAITNRERTQVSQKEFKNRLLSYSWFDAVEKYYNVFFDNHPLSENRV